MRIDELVQDIPNLILKGLRSTEISGVCAHSKLVRPGDLFVVKVGAAFDGRRFIDEALAAGAVALLANEYNPTLPIPQVIHPNLDEIEGLLATRCYGDPAKRLHTIGVTGTNGKTTIVAIIKHLLDQANTPCGLIGTIEYIIGSHRQRATHTTPDVCQNHRMLDQMCQAGCQAAALEVTSHALEQGRVAHIPFDTAIFSNLSPEHLDYHKDMSSYAQAKARLFYSLDKRALAVVNIDDPWHQEVTEKCLARTLSYGLSKEADFHPESLEIKESESCFSLHFQGEHAHFTLPIPGRYNVYNALAAIAAVHQHGIPLQTIAKHLHQLSPVPGRLESVPNDLGIHIYIDFAHTPDALENALSCLHELKTQRLIAIFGCGGDRDAKKRPLMAQACEKWCDHTIVTSDNPRSEDPVSICQDVAAGFSHQTQYSVEVDRRQAIALGIHFAQPGDILVIAGKGHETQQIFSDHTIEFSDKDVAQELCLQKSSQKVSQS